MNSEKECSGCGICAGLCTNGAIKMELNEHGFYRPSINSSKCTGCNICNQVCSCKHGILTKQNKNSKSDLVFGNYQKCYATFSNNVNDRQERSTAGTISSLLKYYCYSFDGIISLCTNEMDYLNSTVNVLKNKDEISKIAKSTYYSVELSEASRFLKAHEGNYLVVGLPCQIATLKNAEHLLKGKITTIELFCGALYSHNFVKQYFKYKKFQPTKIDFRDKCSGWHNFSFSATNKENSQIKTTVNEDDFFFAQMNKFFTQEQCLKCNLCYSGTADIMVGDFWGKKYETDDKGTNLVIARTSQGVKLIENCSDISFSQVDIRDVYNSQFWFVDHYLKNNFKSSLWLESMLHNISEGTANYKIALNSVMYRFINKKNFRKYYKKYSKYYKKKYNLLGFLYNLLPNFIKRIQNTKKENKVKRILIIPSDSTFGSFGDQAMNCALLNQIYKKNPNCEIAVFMPNTYSNDNVLLQYGYNIPIYSPKKSKYKFSLFKKIIPLFDELVVIGADILDGGWGKKLALDYLKFIEIAHKHKLKTIINGFSFNSDLNPKIVKKIRKISKYTTLNVRDNLSCKRLSELNCKNLIQVADIAFLFDEKLYDSSFYCDNLLETLNELKKSNKKLIGLHLTLEENNYDNFLNKLCKGLKGLENTTFVLLPHDIRVYDNKRSDLQNILTVQQYFQNLGIDYINAFDLKNEIDVKTIISQLDLVITSRMHLAIACLSKNVPVLSFVYQGKFEGLYNYFKFNETVLFDKNNYNIDTFMNSVMWIIENENKIKEMLCTCNAKVKQLSLKNISEI